MNGIHVATLSQQRDRLTLAYTTDALEAYDLNTPLISVSLPVLPGAFKHKQVRPFFDGLLPEGEARRMLAYDFRLPEDDTFGLLGALGRDCAGALVILQDGEVPANPPTTDIAPLTPEQVAARLKQLATEPLGVDQQVRISLAGVQQKLVLTQLPTGEWALPVGGLPSTHIFKRANTRFEHMVANEAFCMAIGRRLGLLVAETAIVEFNEPTLVVTRFDRKKAEEGQILRIHQEDLTQALSLNSTTKYEDQGGPSLQRVARLLRDTTKGSESLEQLLAVTVLNMMVGNADAHAKNYSLLHPEPGRVILAPAYDIMSTTFYPKADTRPGMYVNGKTSIHEVTTEDIIAEGSSWGLNRTRVLTQVTTILENAHAAIQAAACDVPGVPSELVTHVTSRAQSFISDLPKP
jgi:serine/threonine-protein kinase HipA